MCEKSASRRFSLESNAPTSSQPECARVCGRAPSVGTKRQVEWEMLSLAVSRDSRADFVMAMGEKYMNLRRAFSSAELSPKFGACHTTLVVIELYVCLHSGRHECNGCRSRMRCPLSFVSIMMHVRRAVYEDVCVEPPYDLALLGKMLAPGRGDEISYDLANKQHIACLCPSFSTQFAKMGTRLAA